MMRIDKNVTLFITRIGLLNNILPSLTQTRANIHVKSGGSLSICRNVFIRFENMRKKKKKLWKSAVLIGAQPLHSTSQEAMFMASGVVFILMWRAVGFSDLICSLAAIVFIPIPMFTSPLCSLFLITSLSLFAFFFCCCV